MSVYFHKTGGLGPCVYKRHLPLVRPVEALFAKENRMYILVTMISPTTLQLAIAVCAFLLCTLFIYFAKAKNSRPEEPVMEVGRDKGMMAFGHKDYQPSVK